MLNITYKFLSNLFYKLPNTITRHKRYYKACFSGVVSLGVQLTVFNIIRIWVQPTWANTIAVEIAILTNFAINHHFTFRDKKQHTTSHKILAKKLISFNAVSLSSMFIQYLCLHLEMKLFGPHLVYENIAVLIGIIIGSIVNFILYQTIVWRHPEE